MEHEVIAFLSQYTALSAGEVETILQLNLIRTYKKGTVLVREGEVASHCYLVLKGCVRSYYLLDGEERITEFYTENQPITPVSYTRKTPSDYYLSCVEDCVLTVSTPQATETLLKKLPKLEAISRMVMGDLLADSQVASDNFRKLSPEGRLRELLQKRPDLCNRVPQYMLASYLGIQPESLSRIRRRIKDHKS